jgi:hypothetical protein
VVSVVALILAATAAPAMPEAIATQLADKLELSLEELARVRSGVIVKELSAESNPRQLSVAAVTWIPAPRRRITNDLWEVRGVPSDAMVEPGGVFSSPPALEDVASFRLPEGDVDLLRSCQVERCKLKIDEAAIGAFGQLDWSSPGAQARADVVARETMLRYAREYERHGSRALPVYADKSERSSVADGLSGLLTHADRLRQFVSPLDRHLRDFPHSELEHTRDLLHWSVHDYGYRPVTMLTHGVLYEPEESPFSLIVQKHILMTHYFVARLELVWMLPDVLVGEPSGTYLVYVDRSLFDEQVSGIKRMMLVRGVLKDVEKRIAAVRALFAVP